MVKQILIAVIVKYPDLWVSCRSIIICLPMSAFGFGACYWPITIFCSTSAINNLLLIINIIWGYFKVVNMAPPLPHSLVLLLTVDCLTVFGFADELCFCIAAGLVDGDVDPFTVLFSCSMSPWFQNVNKHVNHDYNQFNSYAEYSWCWDDKWLNA